MAGGPSANAIQSTLDGLEQNITAATSSAPSLAQNPGAAVTVAQSGGDIPSTAPATAHALSQAQTAHAAQGLEQSHPGVLGSIFGFAGHVVHDVKSAGNFAWNEAMNGTVRMAQHEFRYLYSVYEKHGAFAALGEGLALAAGVAAGSVLTGGLGDALLAGGLEAGAEGVAAGVGEDVAATAGRSLLGQAGHIALGAGKVALGGPGRFAGHVLGAEAATGVTGQVYDRDLWHQTTNPYYRDPTTGRLVNFGNVLAGLLHVNPQTGVFHAVSGVGNAAFDLFADPLQAAGSLHGLAQTAEGLSGLAKLRYVGRSLDPSTITDMAARDFRGYGNVGRALDQIAGMNLGEIMAKYGRDIDTTYKDPATGKTFGDMLAEAKTRDEVVDVFRHKLAPMAWLADNGTLPGASLLHVPFAKLREAMDNAAGEHGGGFSRFNPSRLVAAAGRGFTRVPGQLIDNEGKFVGKTLDPNNQAAAHDIYLYARTAMKVPRHVATDAANLWAVSDVEGRKRIWANMLNDSIMSHAGKEFDASKYGRSSWDALDDPKMAGKIKEFVEGQFRQGPDSSGLYMSTVEGADGGKLVDPATGNKFSGAVSLSQRGVFHIPDHRELRFVAEALSNAKYSRVLAGADDFLYEHVVKRFFTRWVLFSESYALHIALSELLMNIPRQGLRNTIKVAIQGKAIGAGARVESALEAKQTLEAMRVAGATRAELRAAKLTAKQTEDMTNWLEGAVVNLTQARPRIGRLVQGDPQQVGYLADLYHTTEGHPTSQAIAAGHIDQTDPQAALRSGAAGKSGEVIDRLRKLQHRTPGQEQQMKALKSFTGFGPEDEEHIPNWQRWLRRLAKDPAQNAAAKAMLAAHRAGGDEEDITRAGREAAASTIRGYDAETLSTMARSRAKPEGAPAMQDPIDAWAHAAVEDVKGATFSPRTRTPNEGLLDAVARGTGNRRSIPAWGKLKSIDVEDRPLAVPGRLMIPSSHDLLARIAEKGYTKVINPTVNFLSRQVIFQVDYLKARQDLQKMVDKGLMRDDEAHIVAMNRATHTTIKFVHNLHDRTHLDALTQTFAPFFFAQEQAYRRMGRLLATNPGAFRRYQLMLAGATDYTKNLVDKNGNAYVALPGMGFLSGAAAGVLGSLGGSIYSLSPIGFAGNLQATQVIFPLADGVRPNLSPVAMIPAQVLNGLFDELGKDKAFSAISPQVHGALSFAVGEYNLSTPIWQQLVPNTAAYRLIEAAAGNDRSFTSTAIDTIQALSTEDQIAYEDWVKGGKKGDAPKMMFWDVQDGQLVPKDMTPMEQQQAIGRIKNQTRIAFVGRAILGLFSPVSAEVSVKDFGMPEELNHLIQQYGVTAGIRQFLAKNPDATAYTTFHSNTPAGPSLPATDQAMSWITSHMDQIQKYQYGFSWLLPQIDTQGGKYSAAVYNEQLADGLRSYDTPTQFLTNLYASAGNERYYAGLTQHEAILASAGKSARSAEYARWDQETQMLASQNPVWADQFFSNKKLTDAQTAITQLQEVYAQGLAPDTEQSRLVKMVLDAYEQALYQFEQAGSSSNYASAQKAIRNEWESQADQWAAQYPQLSPVIHSVFRDALVTQVTIA